MTLASFRRGFFTGAFSHGSFPQLFCSVCCAITVPTKHKSATTPRIELFMSLRDGFDSDGDMSVSTVPIGGESACKMFTTSPSNQQWRRFNPLSPILLKKSLHRSSSSLLFLSRTIRGAALVQQVHIIYARYTLIVEQVQIRACALFPL